MGFSILEAIPILQAIHSMSFVDETRRNGVLVGLGCWSDGGLGVGRKGVGFCLGVDFGVGGYGVLVGLGCWSGFGLGVGRKGVGFGLGVGSKGVGYGLGIGFDGGGYGVLVGLGCWSGVGFGVGMGVVRKGVGFGLGVGFGVGDCTSSIALIWCISFRYLAPCVNSSAAAATFLKHDARFCGIGDCSVRLDVMSSPACGSGGSTFC
ncbi:acanthoscurrin-1-like [Impatiens glandulifera]|uniref:acanthoscurrin-1-like n=1 Tax=Impatiens glandulifera TaxID=253017 RepID=UPI001FB0DEDE|nr:acanthoscurrin-1-like [Impatiens glandulifera]